MCGRPWPARLVSGAVAQTREKVTLLLNWYVYSEHAPFFLGKDRGYYEAEGIDLDIQEGRGSAVSIQAVAANSATFGYVDVPTMIKAATKGAPVKAVGVALQLSPMSVMGLAEKNIKTPKDIVGKTVAMTPGDSMSQIWPLFLKKTGLQEGQYKIVSGDGQTKLNAVINGQADLLLGYVMDQNIKMQDATKKPVEVIRFADYGVNDGQLRRHRAQGHAGQQGRPGEALHARHDPRVRGDREGARGRRSTRCSRPTPRPASATR